MNDVTRYSALSCDIGKINENEP